MSNGLLKPFMVKAPKLQVTSMLEYADAEEFEWLPFPRPEESRPLPMHQILNGMSGLAQIHSACMALLFDDDERDRHDLPELRRQAEIQHALLQKWRDELPSSLSEVSERVPPAILDLQ